MFKIALIVSSSNRDFSLPRSQAILERFISWDTTKHWIEFEGTAGWGRKEGRLGIYGSSHTKIPSPDPTSLQAPQAIKGLALSTLLQVKDADFAGLERNQLFPTLYLALITLT